MEKVIAFIKKNGSQLVLVVILLLTFVLRAQGVLWGEPVRIHPDEIFSNNAFRQMDIEKFDFNPERAHIEGTLYYYVLSIAVALVKGVSWFMGFLGIGGEGYNLSSPESLVIIGRMVTIGASVLGVYLVYVLGERLGFSKVASLLATLVVAVFPVAITYGHYMRPHTLANVFLITALLVLCTQIRVVAKPLRYAIVGFLLGLATATRYNMAIALLIPGIFLLFEAAEEKLTLKETIFNYANLSLGLAFVLGVFVGDPYLFLSYSTVRPYLEYQSTYVEPGTFAFGNLLDISKPIAYITSLIPKAAQYFLAVGVYVSIILALFNKVHRKLTVALILYLLVYIYLMGKGYAQPIFARAVIPLVPVFGLFTAIATEQVFSLRIHAYVKWIFPLSIAALAIITVFV